jgi:hypothetical protein
MITNMKTTCTLGSLLIAVVVAAPTAVRSEQFVTNRLTYDRLLGTKGRFRFGLEAAANYADLSLRDSRTISGSLIRVTDAYPFTPGTTPPRATPSDPYVAPATWSSGRTNFGEPLFANWVDGPDNVAN